MKKPNIIPAAQALRNSQINFTPRFRRQVAKLRREILENIREAISDGETQARIPVLDYSQDEQDEALTLFWDQGYRTGTTFLGAHLQGCQTYIDWSPKPTEGELTPKITKSWWVRLQSWPAKLLGY